jgi:hypothetical protein
MRSPEAALVFFCELVVLVPAGWSFGRRARLARRVGRFAKIAEEAASQVRLWQKLKMHSSKQSETISKLRARVNDQIGRIRRTKSRDALAFFENIYNKLGLVSHMLADAMIRFP